MQSIINSSKWAILTNVKCIQGSYNIHSTAGKSLHLGNASFTLEYVTTAPIIQSINSILSDHVIIKMHLLTPRQLIANFIRT